MTLIAENGKWVYNIDLNSRTAIRMNNAGYKALQGNSGINMDVAIGAMKIGTEEILGRVCDVWEKGYPYSRAWIWKGIALRKDQECSSNGSNYRSDKDPGKHLHPGRQTYDPFRCEG